MAAQVLMYGLRDEIIMRLSIAYLACVWHGHFVGPSEQIV